MCKFSFLLLFLVTVSQQRSQIISLIKEPIKNFHEVFLVSGSTVGKQNSFRLKLKGTSLSLNKSYKETLKKIPCSQTKFFSK